VNPASGAFIPIEGSWLDGNLDHCGALPIELAQAAAEQLHRPNGGPGYVIMRGSAVDLGLHQTRAFQVALLRAVWEDMVRRKWVWRRPDEIRLKEFEAVDGKLPREIVGDVNTFKRLHFDPFSLIFAHLYEAVSNLTGGTISLVDVDGYLRDSHHTLSDVFEPLHAPGHNGRLVAKEEHRQSMLRMYAHNVEPPRSGDLLLLIVRNDPSVGVAHEIGEVYAVDPTLPTLRQFYRTSIAPHH
jgi:hypothetical protein